MLKSNFWTSRWNGLIEISDVLSDVRLAEQIILLQISARQWTAGSCIEFSCILRPIERASLWDNKLRAWHIRRYIRGCTKLGVGHRNQYPAGVIGHWYWLLYVDDLCTFGTDIVVTCTYIDPLHIYSMMRLPNYFYILRKKKHCFLNNNNLIKISQKYTFWIVIRRSNLYKNKRKYIQKLNCLVTSKFKLWIKL